jgi:hypothetical protein
MRTTKIVFFFLETDKIRDIWQAHRNPNPYEYSSTLPEVTQDLINAVENSVEYSMLLVADDMMKDYSWITSVHEVQDEPTESLVVIMKKSLYQDQFRMPKLDKHRVTQEEIRDWLSYHIRWEDTKNKTAILTTPPTEAQIMRTFGLQLDSNALPTDDDWYKENFIFIKTKYHGAIWKIIHGKHQADNEKPVIKTTKQLLFDVLNEAVQGGWVTSLHEMRNKPTEALIVIATKVAHQHLKNRDINHLPWNLLQCQGLVRDCHLPFNLLQCQKLVRDVRDGQITKKSKVHPTAKKGRHGKRRVLISIQFSDNLRILAQP